MIENNVELLAGDSQSVFSDLGMDDFELDYTIGNIYAEENSQDSTRANELEVLNRQSMRTSDTVNETPSRVSCGVQVTFSNERQEVTMSCSEASNSCSQTSNASTVYLLKNIQRVGVSENKCMICKSSEGRCRVPRKAMWQVWSEKQIVIPNGKRTCNSHLINSRFTKEALDSIIASKEGVEMTGTELGQWILEVTTSSKSSKPMFQFIDDSMDSKTYKSLFGLMKDQFNDLYQKYIEPTVMRDTKCRNKREALAMFLIMIRKNMDQETIGFLFHCSQSVVSDSITAVSDTLIKSLVVEHLGYQAMPRQTAIREHNRTILHKILGLEADQLAIIADGTYLYVEQPLDLQHQRLLYSGHKNRNLIKPMMLVLPSGYILECAGPYGANGTNNDSTIMQLLMLEPGLPEYVQPRDHFVIDRGFQNICGEIEHAGYGVFMPQLLKKDQCQFTVNQANQTRKVTKNRWVVESANGRMKNVWKFFKHMIEGSYTPSVMKFFRVACAISNRYFVQLQQEKPIHDVIARKVLERQHRDNELQKKIDRMNIQGRLLVSNWQKGTSEIVEDFPRLSMAELEDLTLGDYQLKKGLRYVHQHLSTNGSFDIYLYKHSDFEGHLISAKIQSRYRSNVKHLLWIQYDPAIEGTDSILGRYCRCPVGSRTVGMCSHLAAVSLVITTGI